MSGSLVRLAVVLLFGGSIVCGAQAQGSEATPQDSTSQGSAAQGEPHHGPPSPAQELARLTHALGLTNAQQAAILPILTKRQQEMEALRAGGTSPEAGREQMHAIMESCKASIRAQLTEAQQQIFDAMRPPQRRGPGSGDPGGESGGPPSPPSGDSF